MCLMHSRVSSHRVWGITTGALALDEARVNGVFVEGQEDLVVLVYRRALEHIAAGRFSETHTHIHLDNNIPGNNIPGKQLCMCARTRATRQLTTPTQSTNSEHELTARTHSANSQREFARFMRARNRVTNPQLRMHMSPRTAHYFAADARKEI
jgi:hypothetical protein